MYDNLLGQGVNPSLAAKLDEIHQQGLLQVDELDDRALEALKEFTEEDALNVLGQFMKSDLTHVQNKSAFLCGVMKTYRAKMKLKSEEAATNPSASTSATPQQQQQTEDGKKGPNEDKVKQLLNRTGYTLDITTGQRKYGGPPPGWEGPAPGTGEKKFCSQVFIGKIPRDMYEDELVPLFEPYGQIYDLRIMVDPFSGLNKGYAFVTYSTKEGAQSAVKAMENHEVRGGKKLGVCLSQANNRLFVGSIPKTKTKQDIMEEFKTKVEELTDVIMYFSAEDKNKNRGFVFLDFATHKDAAQARRKLQSGRIKVFGHITPAVDWADSMDEPNDEVMSKVKVVYVRHLSPAIDENKLNELFEQYGPVEKVKKIKDYAFINFANRDDAMRAIEELDNQELDDLKISVQLAKPQVDKTGQRRGQSGFGTLNKKGQSDNFVPRGRGGFSGRGAGGPRGRGRGGFGSGFSHGGDYSQGGYRGYGDDSYDDYYAPPARPRGGPPSRGPSRGGAMRGGRGSPRGGSTGGFRGASRGGSSRGGTYGQQRGGMNRGRGGFGRGGSDYGSGRGGSRGGTGGYGSRGRGAGAPKRKADYGGDYGTPSKRKNEWNSQPIAQQPLGNSSSNYYNDDYSGGDWYTDLSEPRWQ